MNISRIRVVSSPASAPSWVRSTIFDTRCHELSFSRSASMSSSLACSSSRFLAIFVSRLVSRPALNSSSATRAASTISAFLAFSSSLRAVRVTCHSSFHFCIALGSLDTGTSPARSSGSSLVSTAISASSGGGARTIGASVASAGGEANASSAGAPPANPISSPLSWTSPTNGAAASSAGGAPSVASPNNVNPPSSPAGGAAGASSAGGAAKN
mmetsp:Transcript_54073/g.131258  ORF Transcript_54073/g.131258 Transcript_54073/m.131258 type:complete len:213 (+) Transcript_54073:315-953(+)